MIGKLHIYRLHMRVLHIKPWLPNLNTGRCDVIDMRAAGSRLLPDAMASIVACAACTVRLWRAIAGDCSDTARSMPVVAFFGLQALPLALICCRRSDSL